MVPCNAVMQLDVKTSPEFALRFVFYPLYWIPQTHWKAADEK